jgi:hypothetical protein
VKKMSKKRIAFEMNETLYQQIENLAQIFHTNVSTISRQALQAFVDAHQAKPPAVAPPKPVEDPDDKVGIDGWTNAERRAIRAQAEAQRNQTTERPRELSQGADLKTIVDEWQ